MVIAHVIDSMEVGGAEAVVQALCRLQRAAGHSPSVHCLHHLGSFGEELAAEGIPVHVHGPARGPQIMRRLFAAFRAERPEVVHCHNKSATVHAAVVARLAGARVLVSTRHGMAAPPYSFRKEFKFWMISAMFCDRVVAVCETARHNMMAGARQVAHKVTTIRNGAYPPRVDEAAVSQPSGFVLVTVGRLAPVKNYSALLRAVALARQQVPDLTLRFVGDGPERQALVRLTAELGLERVVEFCGTRSDVGTFLHGSDVFVLSSLSEGLPISILEAMAAGLPAIATEVGGMPEVVGLSKAGKTVPPGNVEALANAIVEFARQRSSLAELGQRARDCYRSHFTPEHMSDQYLTLYRVCLAGRDSGAA